MLGRLRQILDHENFLDVRETRQNLLVLRNRATNAVGTADAWAQWEEFIAVAEFRDTMVCD